jgi:Xanthine and CO dehydrogenases maturation factor, XdhC/CoxF family
MNVNTYESLLNELDAGKKAVVITLLNNSESESKINQNKFLLTEEDLNADKYIYNFNDIVYQKSKYALETGNLQFIKVSEEVTYLIEPYIPEPKLIILGGGHIAKPLAEFGTKAGFSVIVIDDRPSFANKERFPSSDRVICESFEKCFDSIKINEFTFVVIVTRGHRHDMDCLRQVLKYKTAYTGMIGSKRRVKGVMEQMISEGYSKGKLDKVNAPIGIEIGAVTPEEIAFSIIAQVILYRRHINVNKNSSAASKFIWPEFDRDVLAELSKEEDSSKAIITIIATKGSVPRKEGAKMLVWPFGKLLGSIGGGCSEGEVINIARDIIRNGGYQVHSIDMTGYVAEDEGMVCGGIMDVVIEAYEN